MVQVRGQRLAFRDRDVPKPSSDLIQGAEATSDARVDVAVLLQAASGCGEPLKVQTCV